MANNQSHLPPAVAKAAADAEKLHQQIYNPETPDTAAEGPKAASTVEGDVKQGDQAPTEPAQGAEPPKKEEPAQAPLQAPIIPQAEYDKLKHQHSTLQGLYGKQNQQIRDLTDEIEQLKLRINSDDVRREQGEQKPPSELTPAEIEEYGAEFVEVIRKAARESVQGELDELRRENQQLKGLVDNTANSVKATAKERFETYLDQNAPNWRELNTDPGFLSWLSEIEPYAGRPRQELLTEAAQNQDGHRTALFFKNYQAEKAQQVPATPTAQVPLDTQVAPSARTAAPAQTQEPQKRIWTEGEVRQFYQDSVRGKYRNKQDEYRRIELEIQDAVREGRIAQRPQAAPY